jgi:glycosyltransferase involved in cell wall biosynthesis
LADRKLKILMLAPTPYFADRGCHVRIYEEARALVELGQAVQIVTYHLGRDMPGIPTWRIAAIPWYRKLAAGPSWHKPYLDILLFFKALQAARQFKPDLIHAHLHEGAFIGIFLKMFLKAPLLFDCQGSLTAELIDHGFFRKGSILHRAFRLLEGFINRRADFVLTSSGAGAQDLLANWQMPERKVRALIDAVDTEIFRPYPQDEARRALGLPFNVPLVVYLGVLNAYQGIDLLLECVRILQQRGEPLHFLIMGFPDEKYRKKAVELGIAELITFTGRVDYGKAPLYLSAGDIAVSPKISLTEANGKLFNYLACGLPTVVFDTPTNREILGDAGVYACFGDAADLAHQLALLMRDHEGRTLLARKVRQRSEHEHSWQARGRELLGVYRRCMGTSP